MYYDEREIAFYWTTEGAKYGVDYMTFSRVLRLHLPGGRPFCIVDFIWNELRRTMVEAKNSLPAAPYIMYMIERVTKVTF